MPRAARRRARSFRNFRNHSRRRVAARLSTVGRVKSNPQRFRLMVAAQISAYAPADAAKSDWVNGGFRCRTRSGPNPAGAARCEPAWSAGQMSFPAFAILRAGIPASRPRAGSRRLRHSETLASPADNPPVTSATAKISRWELLKMSASAPALPPEFSANHRGWTQAQPMLFQTLNFAFWIGWPHQ